MSAAEDASQPPAARKPWRSRVEVRIIIGVMAIVLVADGLLALLFATLPRAPGVEVRDPQSLRTELARVASAEGEGVLLLGDSVLAGDVMDARVEHAEGQRVIDHLRAEVHADEAASWAQVALNGLLPIDMLHVVDELDSVDPAGDVTLIVELNLRYFSAHYADVDTCTRDWLCAVGTEGDGALGHRFTAVVDALIGFVRRHTPILRHRDSLYIHRFLSKEVPNAIVPQAPPQREQDAESSLLALARIRDHYRVSIANASEQKAALEAILARARERGRRVIFFSTPLRDSFVEGLLGERSLGDVYGALSAWTHRHGGARAQYRSLDHLLFVEEHFLDHCHLRPEGNRLLALNLIDALDMRFARLPRSEDLAYRRGRDATLLARRAAGSGNGPPWMAALRGPRGIAFASDPPRLVVADTGNHVVRRMQGRLETLEPFAGTPGEEGSRDGPADEARFVRPRAPAILGSDVYVIDGERGRLRHIRDDRVDTIAPPSATAWTDLRGLRVHRDALFLQDQSTRILRLEPEKSEASLVFESGGDFEIRSFEIADDGRLLVVDAQSRIWSGPLQEHEVVSPDELTLVFGNTGADNMPASDRRFPLEFDEVRFAAIRDLRWVPRYEGLLVVDEVPLTPDPADVTERAHIRFLDLARRQVHPWLKPLVDGKGYFPRRVAGFRGRGAAFASYYHSGSLALDSETAELYWLETHRSRMIRIRDGLLGVAKTGELGIKPTALGARAPYQVLRTFHPERFLRAADGRRGPFVGLILGSSLTTFADNNGQVSYARMLERELVRRFSDLDDIDFDLFARSEPTGYFSSVTANAAAFIENEFVPDVILIEVPAATRAQKAEMKHRGRNEAALTSIVGLCRQYDVELILIEDVGMGSRGRDGMRQPPEPVDALMKQAESLGVDVVRVADRLLPDLLELAPWGNPPYNPIQIHGSPQAIFRTGEVLAARLHPLLRERFATRVPSLARGDASDVAEDDRPHLRDVLAAGPLPVLGPKVRLPRNAIQVATRGAESSLLVDLGRIDDSGDPETLNERIVLSALQRFVLRDIRGDVTARLRIEIVRFANYDEYGRGAIEGATTVLARDYDADGLATYLDRLRAAGAAAR